MVGGMTDPVTLICGGTAPIGAAIAQRLVQGGARRLAIAGRDAARGAQVVARLRALAEGEFAFIPADLARPDGPDRLFAAMAGTYGPRLDAYVHCVPPGAATGPLATADLDRFAASMTVGLGALAACCRAAAAMLRAGGGGAMLTFASDAGKLPGPRKALVGTVQSGVMALTRGLALELARDRIRVNAISPTYVRGTPLFDRIGQGEAGARSLAAAEARAPLGLPEPQDIAELAAFLLGPGAARITGQIVSINGGLSAV